MTHDLCSHPTSFWWCRKIGFNVTHLWYLFYIFELKYSFVMTCDPSSKTHNPQLQPRTCDQCLSPFSPPLLTCNPWPACDPWPNLCRTNGHLNIKMQSMQNNKTLWRWNILLILYLTFHLWYYLFFERNLSWWGK